MFLETHTALKELRGDAKRKNRTSHRWFRANIKSNTLLCSFLLKELPSRMCRLSSNSKVPLLFCPLLFSWFLLSVLLNGTYPKLPSFIHSSVMLSRQSDSRSISLSAISLSAASSFCVKIWASDRRHNSSSTTQTSDPRPHSLLLLLVCFSFSLFFFFLDWNLKQKENWGKNSTIDFNLSFLLSMKGSLWVLLFFLGHNFYLNTSDSLKQFRLK